LKRQGEILLMAGISSPAAGAAGNAAAEWPQIRHLPVKSKQFAAQSFKIAGSSTF
jgi:hypothetical protein